MVERVSPKFYEVAVSSYSGSGFSLIIGETKALRVRLIVRLTLKAAVLDGQSSKETR